MNELSVVDIYCRVSTDPQEDNTSLDEQEAAGREYCQQHGLTVDMVHREVFSGYQYRERKGLEHLRVRYREGKIQGVVIRTLDRLSRSQTHVAILMEEMEHHGVTLYSVKEVIDDTPMGKFARMILAFFAEMEREKIMDRTIAGKISRAKAGKVVSGNKPLYGWKWDDPIEKNYLVLDDFQARVLREAGQEYADGVSLRTILKRLEDEGVPPPKSDRWYPKTLRNILTDPRMTGKDVQIFTVKNKRARQHLEPITLPDGTYPRILSDEVYAKVLERAAHNSATASRNSKYPEMFLLRAGFARCGYCKQTMMAKHSILHGGRDEWFAYACPNRFGQCTRFTVAADRLDAAVWGVVEQLADHIALIEKSVRLAMENRSLDEDLRATDAALADWKAKVENYEGDLQDSSLRGTTRAGIRNLLNATQTMVEELERQHAELAVHFIDRDRVHAEYEKVLAWCKKVKGDREELTYQQKRDFLYMLGATVLVYKQEYRDAPPTWDIRVALPTVQEIIYQGHERAFGGSLSIGRNEPTSLQRFSSRIQ